MPTIVLSGGGTAGHINPAIALAQQLESRGFDVVYAGTPKGIEARLVPAAGIPFKAFKASGFDRQRPWTLVSGVWRIWRSSKLAEKWFKVIKPVCVVGFGGYVSIPVVRAAQELGIPTVIHEQNSVMGLANKELSKAATSLCLTYENTSGVPKGKEGIHVTGNPVRASVLEATREDGRRYLGIPDDADVLLVFGGSLGARHINQVVAGLKDDLLSRENLYIVHITGPKELESVKEALLLTGSEAERYILKGYEDNMDLVLAASDMILSRSGATSLAEIASRAIPAILVPFPYATADHQRTNAESMVDIGAAVIVSDDELESDTFEGQLFNVIDDPAVRQRMHEAALGLEAGKAAEKLADITVECASTV